MTSAGFAIAESPDRRLMQSNLELMQGNLELIQSSSLLKDSNLKLNKLWWNVSHLMPEQTTNKVVVDRLLPTDIRCDVDGPNPVLDAANIAMKLVMYETGRSFGSPTCEF